MNWPWTRTAPNPESATITKLLKQNEKLQEALMEESRAKTAMLDRVLVAQYDRPERPARVVQSSTVHPMSAEMLSGDPEDDAAFVAGMKSRTEVPQ